MICLLLAGYALQMLPVNYAGLALIVVGIGLMVAEAFQPGFGVLGIGGAVSFVFGSVILMDTDLPAYQISMPIIAAFAVVVSGRSSCSSSAPPMQDATPEDRHRARVDASAPRAVVMDDFDGRGLVRLHGEIWQAASRVPLAKGTQVRIVAIDDLVLTVEPQEQT